jgi:hypothetical protein
MMGIHLDGPANIFCDNEDVVRNSTMPESTLKRKHVDKHLFHMSAEQRITQSLDRKQQWMECVTIAYETLPALHASQIPSQRQLAPLWNKALGHCQWVRLQPEC